MEQHSRWAYVSSRGYARWCMSLNSGYWNCWNTSPGIRRVFEKCDMTALPVALRSPDPRWHAAACLHKVFITHPNHALLFHQSTLQQGEFYTLISSNTQSSANLGAQSAPYPAKITGFLQASPTLLKRWPQPPNPQPKPPPTPPWCTGVLGLFYKDFSRVNQSSYTTGYTYR